MTLGGTVTLAVYTQFNWFNMFKPEYKYNDLVFSMKFFMYNRGEMKYFMPDIKTAKAISPQFAILVSYILQTGIRLEDEFVLPHSSMDFIIDNLRRIQNVCYKDPGRRINLSNDTYAPTIKTITINEEETRLELEEGYEIIYGKFLGYTLYDNTLYLLPKDFPISLCRMMNGDGTVIKTRLIPEHLKNG